MTVQHNKGKIRDNALKALVRSNVFRHTIQANKKGKGSYRRQAAKKIRDVFQETSLMFCAGVVGRPVKRFFNLELPN